MRQGRAVMSQPQLLHLRVPGKGAGLVNHHVPVFLRVGEFLRLCVHALADEQIRGECILNDRRSRPCVRDVGQLQSLPLLTKHHVRGKCSPACRVGHRVSLLKGVPVLERNLGRLRPLRVKLPGAIQHQAVTVAYDPVIDAKCPQPVTVHDKFLLRLLDLHTFHLKWKLRSDHTQGVHHPGQPSRADDRQRLGALGIAHREQKPREPADMVTVKMSNADHIDRLETPAFFTKSDLCSLAAVDQQA